MNSLTKQLRAAITTCGTDPDELAHAVGISSARMQRFLSGASPLPIRVADLLCEELGLRLGPLLAADDLWQIHAVALAEDAHRNAFEVRRGVSVAAGPAEALVLFNNNPYQGNPRRRDEEERRLLAWLSSENILVLGRGSFPVNGDHAGYTTTIVLKAREDRQNEIMAKWDDIVDQCEAMPALSLVHA